MAYQLSVRNNIKTPLKSNEVGRSWVDLFLNRHRGRLSLRKQCGTNFARALDFNKENVKNFLNFILEEANNKSKFSPGRIYNVDETGLSIFQSRDPSYVIGRKDKRRIAALTFVKRGEIITVIAYMRLYVKLKENCFKN